MSTTVAELCSSINTVDGRNVFCSALFSWIVWRAASIYNSRKRPLTFMRSPRLGDWNTEYQRRPFATYNDCWCAGGRGFLSRNCYVHGSCYLFVASLLSVWKKQRRFICTSPTLGHSLFSIVSTKFIIAHVLRQRHREASTIFGCLIFKSLNSSILTFFSVTMPNSISKKCKWCLQLHLLISTEAELRRPKEMFEVMELTQMIVLLQISFG